MGKYFIGKEVQLLTEEDEEKIKIHKLDLLKEEFGHMPWQKRRVSLPFCGRRRADLSGKPGMCGNKSGRGFVY